MPKGQRQQQHLRLIGVLAVDPAIPHITPKNSEQLPNITLQSKRDACRPRGGDMPGFAQRRPLLAKPESIGPRREVTLDSDDVANVVLKWEVEAQQAA